MSASLDRRMLELPLSELTAAEVPMAILLRKRSGELNEAEANHAVLTNLAACVSLAIESGDHYELLTFINGVNETIEPEHRPQATAVEVGTIPDEQDASNTLVVVMGEHGCPVLDGDGRMMIFSLKQLDRITALSMTTPAPVPH